MNREQEPSKRGRFSRRQFIKKSALAVAGTTVTGGLLAACGDATPTVATTTAASSATTAASAATTVATSATTAATSATTAASAATTAAASTTTVAAATAATGPTLRLGALLPFSGVYSQLGADIVDGMNLYFESVGNVVAGRKIELLKEDEENEPAAALRKARKLVESDKVDMVTGIVSSAIALGVRDYMDESKALLIISNAGAKALTGDRFSKYIFRTSFSNGQVPWPLGQWAYNNVGKNIFISAPDYAAGKESAEGFKTPFTKAGGKIAGEQYPPFGKTSDYAPFLSAIQAAKPDAVYAFYSGSEAVNFVKQYEQFGLKKDIPLIGAGFMIEEDTLPAQGTSAIGVRTSLHYSSSLDTPENKKFVADFTAKFKRPPSTFALQGFDTARFIAEGLTVTKGDTSNKDALIKAFEGIKFVSPRGPIETDAATHSLTQNMYLREVIAGPDGKPVQKVIQTFEKIQDINVLLKK